MKIDLKKIKSECPQFTLESEFMTRRVITEINKQRNILTMNRKFYDKLVVGIDLLLILQDSSGFLVNFGTMTDELEFAGNLMAIKIYRDNTYQIKDNEIFFFDDDNDLPFRKPYQRRKKLERILKDEL